MKPFDLEAAKAGKPLVTRDGREVRGFAIAEGGGPFPCVAHIDGEGWLSMTVRGTEFECSLSDADLFMAVDKRTVYVNLLDNGDAYYYETAERANEAGYQCIAKSVPLTFEV